MNNRIFLVVTTVALISTSTGCGHVRNFLFGRGAKCGLCTRVAPRVQPLANRTIPAPPACAVPTYVQPGLVAAPGSCGTCNTDPCGNLVSQYGTDPYGCGVVGSELIPNGSGNWQPRSYSSGYPYMIDDGYKLDKDGARIIHEDPMPSGATLAE